MSETHRHFFALLPEAHAAARMEGAAQRLLSRHPRLGRPMPRARLHVSLNGLGLGLDPGEPRIRRAVRAAAEVRPPAFRVAFNRVATFGRGEGPRAVVLRGDEGVLGVDLLQTALHAALVEASLVRRRPRAFEAHVTLVRGQGEVPETPVPTISWTVREFLLVHSIVGRGCYDVVARFPLA